MPIVEAVPEIVKVTTTMIPALQNVRFLRGVLVPLSRAGDMNESKALENYEAMRKKDEQRRTKLKKKYNSKVIKISDAMECVEKSLYDGKLAIALGKGIIESLLGRGSGAGAPGLVFDQIAQCMITKALQQKNARSLGKYVKTKGPGLPGPEKQPTFTEIVKLRRGKLHPFIPK